MSTDPQPRHHSEIDRTMNLPERMNSHHTNGQAASHHPGHGLSPAAENHDLADPLPIATGAGQASQPDLSWALKNAQDNLLALQRLAEQTAELHRQFLEGQEKTQQTFLKLLEHQQRLSLAVVDSERTAVPRFDRARGSVPFKPPLPRRSARSRPRERTASCRPSHNPPPLSIAIASTLIEVVAQKTGYPAEVLDLDMQLDADLGIDSIKRVEILSALQDRLPRPATVPTRTTGLVPQPAHDRRLHRSGSGRPTALGPKPAAQHRRAQRLGSYETSWRGRCWKRSPRRRDTPSTCSSSICGSTPTWASTRSSGSRSSRRSRTSTRIPLARVRRDRDAGNPARHRCVPGTNGCRADGS